MGRVTKFMEKTNMKSVFCAGAGIQSVLFFLNDGYLPAGRELSPRTRVRVAAPSICFVPWTALASRWPLPQQQLLVSAAGGSRCCCRPFHRPPYCLQQQGPTPADGPRRNSRPAGKGGRQVAVIQKKQYALDAGTCAKYAFHVGFLHEFCNAAQGEIGRAHV